MVFLIGHVRTLPRLVKAPFQFATYAYKYVDVAKRLTKKPIKQAVITASALSMVYTPHLLKTGEIDNYPREQFLKDLVNECEKDIRLCLGQFNLYHLFSKEIFAVVEHGAQVVQLDFTEARLSLKIDPTGQLLKEYILINNRVLDRFSADDQKKLGVHVCPGGDCDCYVSYFGKKYNQSVYL
jgi:5-methyltetrahydropteroyltriglutamate--homocysteine methyltransferase